MRRLVLVAFVACGPAFACAPPRHDARAANDLVPPADLARICVVRPAKIAKDVTLLVRDNGRVVGATRGATYACWLAAPGVHQVASDADDTGPTLVQATAGARTWIHQEVSDLGGYAHAHLDLVDDETAHELVDDCEARVMVSVPGHDASPSSMPIAPARL